MKECTYTCNTKVIEWEDIKDFFNNLSHDNRKLLSVFAVCITLIISILAICRRREVVNICLGNTLNRINSGNLKSDMPDDSDSFGICKTK